VDRLCQILWHERELLELLSSKLGAERLVRASGVTHELATVARDIEEVLASLREVELMRAVAADTTAEELGLAPNPSLAALAQAAPEPWGAILVEHRDALVALARQIAELSAQSQSVVSVGDRAARLLRS
jgi:hypothetical protein